MQWRSMGCFASHLIVQLNLRSLVLPKQKKNIGEGRGNKTHNGWKISACTVASVCVHANTHTTAVLNIFPPFLREVLNFRPHVGYSSSLQYVKSCPSALLIILISLIRECLSFGNCPTPQKVSARMRLTSRVPRPTGRVRSSDAQINMHQLTYVKESTAVY